MSRTYRRSPDPDRIKHPHVDQSQLLTVGQRVGSYTVINVGIADNHVRVGWQDGIGQMFAYEGRIS
jgi:hypothetical protein